MSRFLTFSEMLRGKSRKQVEVDQPRLKQYMTALKTYVDDLRKDKSIEINVGSLLCKSSTWSKIALMAYPKDSKTVRDKIAYRVMGSQAKPEIRILIQTALRDAEFDENVIQHYEPTAKYHFERLSVLKDPPTRSQEIVNIDTEKCNTIVTDTDIIILDEVMEDLLVHVEIYCLEVVPEKGKELITEELPLNDQNESRKYGIENSEGSKQVVENLQAEIGIDANVGPNCIEEVENCLMVLSVHDLDVGLNYQEFGNSREQNLQQVLSDDPLSEADNNPSTSLSDTEDHAEIVSFPDNCVHRKCMGCTNSVSLVEETDSFSESEVFCENCVPTVTNMSHPLLTTLSFQDETINNESTTVCNGDENSNKEDRILSITTICSILKVKPDDLEYIGPTTFELVVPFSDVAIIYNKKTETFYNNLWPAAIDRAMKKSQSICSFNAEKAPYYYGPTSRIKRFARCLGKCAGGCEIRFAININETPKLGEDLKAEVTSAGAFTLVQNRPTGRKINGSERKALASKLEHVKARHVFLDNTAHTSGLHLLHNNQLQKSPAVLRNIRSEAKAGRRHDKTSESLDIEKFRDELNCTHNSTMDLNGYIQHCATTAGDLSIHMYDYGSCHLMSDSLKLGLTILYFDASGGFVNRIEPKTLLYTAVARNQKGISFILGEMLSQRHSSQDITNFLGRVNNEVLKVRPYQNRPLADIIVVDFSFAMIHGCLLAVNSEGLEDYMKRAWDYLCDKTNWSDKKCCIFICTSHLVNAFKRNITHKMAITQSKAGKELRSMALKALARLQETCNIVEFEATSKYACNIFGNEYISDEKLIEYKNFFTLSDEDVESMGGNEDDYIAVEELDRNSMDEKKHKLLREKSKFYHKFKSIREVQMLKYETVRNSLLITNDGINKNPYHCAVVIDVLEKTYVPYYSLWAASVVRKARNKNFLRETNATVESEFKERKYHLHTQRNINTGDFLRKEFEIVQSKNKLAVIRTLQGPISIKKRPQKVIEDTESIQLEAHTAEERWSRKGTAVARTSRHLSDKSMFNSKKLNTKALDTASIQTLSKVWEPKSDTIYDTCMESMVISKRIFPEEVQENVESNDEVLIDATVPQYDNEELSITDIEEFSIDSMLEEIVFQVEGYSLKLNELKELVDATSYLSDNLLNGWLKSVTEQQENESIFISNTAWFFKDRQGETSLLIEQGSLYNDWKGLDDLLLNLQNQHIILHPLKINQHWIGLFIDIKNKTIIIYDSKTPSEQGAQHVLYSSILENLTPRIAHVEISLSNVSQWTFTVCANFPQQKDQSSCGAYVMLALEIIYNSYPLEPNFEFIEQITEMEMRMHILCHMLSTTDNGNLILKMHGEGRTNLVEFLNGLAASGNQQTTQVNNFIQSMTTYEILQDPATLLGGMQSFNKTSQQHLDPRGKGMYEELLRRSESSGCQDGEQQFGIRALYKNYDEKLKLYEGHCSTIIALNQTAIEEQFDIISTTLLDIFEGNRTSVRMELFVSESLEERKKTKKLIVSSPFSQPQSMLVASKILELICPNAETRLKFNNFVLEVLLPEGLIMIYSNVTGISLEMAEKELINGPRYD